MKQNCEICGHELGFFERSLNIENIKLGLSYDTLCSACHRSIMLAVDKIEAISTAVRTELTEKLSKYRYAPGDINVLIFLAVKEIFEYEPDFDDWDKILAQTFFPEEQRLLHSRFDYLILITYKVLRNGFSPILGRYGLDSLEAFIGYMSRNCYFDEQVMTNCSPDGSRTYTDLFMSPAGIVFYDTVNKSVRTLFVSRDRTLKLEEKHTSGTYDVILLRQHFKKLRQKPTIYFNRLDQRREFVEKVESYNNKKEERIEGELTNLINNLNINIEKDLRNMHPFEELSDIPFDSVLVSIIKTLFEEDIEQEYVEEAPDGLLNLIVERGYMDNLEKSDIEGLEGIQDYISKKCLFVTDFNAALGGDKLRPSFAFLTPRAYMIKPLETGEAFMNAKTDWPNDLYTDFQYMIYQGKREFYITTASSEKKEDGFYYLSGVRIHADDEAVLSELENYFSKKARSYYKCQLDKELLKLDEDSLRRQEVLDAARRIFVGFGYLPFCIYDEWAEIERILRLGDLMMADLIEEREPKTGTHNEKIFYASKTVNSFEQEAAKLAESFEINKLPIARGLLWGALKDEILSVCSEEFIRLCGDIAQEDDDLEAVFLKYSALDNIQPEKAYYLGLFIYYLMQKGFLPKTDFLDHYDQVAKTYIKLNPARIKQIEFSELGEPKRRAFDTEVVDFSNFKSDTKKDTLNEDSFIYSVRKKSGDTDSIDNLVRALNESLASTQEDEISELISDLVIETRGEKEEKTTGAEHLENANSESSFQGVEFIDVDSESTDVESPAQILETNQPVIGVEELSSEPKRMGFDSVREIVGLNRKTKK